MGTWRRPGISEEGPRTRLEIGSRGSALARVQAEYVRDLVLNRYPGLHIEVRYIQTTGDMRTDVPLQEIGGKGLFIKEIDQALLRGDVQLAVHSLKDLPGILAEAVSLGAVPEREDPRDAWIHRDGTLWTDAPPGTRVGTSSLRRACVVRAQRPDMEVVPLRGNVDTRLRKAQEGDGVDAIILASAGLRRLGRADAITDLLDPAVFVPAVGQGALGVTYRSRDANTRSLVYGLNHPASRIAAEAERAFLRVVEGDCRIPVGAHAVVDDNVLTLHALLGTPDGSKLLRMRREGFSSMPEQLGVDVAEAMLADGGAEILEEVRGG